LRRGKASLASLGLADFKSSAAERSAAASALTPYQDAEEVSSARKTSVASAPLRDPKSSGAEKPAATGSLSRRIDT
jgi:hypothetical protein